MTELHKPLSDVDIKIKALPGDHIRNLTEKAYQAVLGGQVRSVTFTFNGVEVRMENEK